MFTVKTWFYKLMTKVLKVALKFIPMKMPLMFSGKGSHLNLAKFIAQQNANKVMLVTDEGITKIGLHRSLLEELEREGVKVCVFDKVTPDPSDRLIEQGASLYSAERCDAVVGFGGGSAMDAAKLISVLPYMKKPLAKIAGVLKIKKSGAPLFLLPTTAGTGSEVTLAAVFTDSNSGQKIPVADPVLVPMAVSLDPGLMAGLPAHITATTGFDALTHAVEAYISKNADAESDRFAKIAVSLIWQNLLKCIESPSDLSAREAMSVASSYAGIAFSKAGLGYVHGIAHQLGAFYHVPHGLANALALPHVLSFSLPDATKPLAELAREVGIEGSTDEILARNFVAAVFSLREKVGLPSTLSSLKKEDFQAISVNALKESHSYYAVPRYMRKEQCMEILSSLCES
jgi:alcohol dehydrogenase class IV